MVQVKLAACTIILLSIIAAIMITYDVWDVRVFTAYALMMILTETTCILS